MFPLWSKCLRVAVADVVESASYRALSGVMPFCCVRTEELIPTVRKAIGEDTALLVDGNSCYTPKRAIEVGKILEDSGGGHFEEPCPHWELEWTQEATAALGIDVAGGEQDNDLTQWWRMIAMDVVDIVQPDICYVGGLTRALEVAKMASEAGKPCKLQPSYAFCPDQGVHSR